MRPLPAELVPDPRHALGHGLQHDARRGGIRRMRVRLLEDNVGENRHRDPLAFEAHMRPGHVRIHREFVFAGERELRKAVVVVVLKKRVALPIVVVDVGEPRKRERDVVALLDIQPKLARSHRAGGERQRGDPAESAPFVGLERLVDAQLEKAVHLPVHRPPDASAIALV